MDAGDLAVSAVFGILCPGPPTAKPRWRMESENGRCVHRFLDLESARLWTRGSGVARGNDGRGEKVWLFCAVDPFHRSRPVMVESHRPLHMHGSGDCMRGNRDVATALESELLNTAISYFGIGLGSRDFTSI